MKFGDWWQVPHPASLRKIRSPRVAAARLKRHVTTYRYTEPVRFGEHRMMFRPRESHDLRLLSTMLDIVPRPSGLCWLHDVFDNSVAIATFDEAASELRFESAVTLEQIQTLLPDYALEIEAHTYPFHYSDDERPDLIGALARQYPCDDLGPWTARFLSSSGLTPTMVLLHAMMRGIKEQFVYVRRSQKGVQSPAETLQRGSGSCRDFAVLMMEAVRSLGFAARFGQRIHLRAGNGPGWYCRWRHNAWLDAGVLAGSRMGRLRPHQQPRRESQPDSCGRGVGPAERAAAIGHVHRAGLVIQEHGRDRERHRRTGGVRQAVPLPT